MDKIDLKKGTISFWIPEGVVVFNDSKSHILVNMQNDEGSIFIVKDDDNKMKFFHVIIGRGRTDVEVDVSDLSSNERHMVAATWDISTKEICLYIDGDKKKSKATINYNINGM